MRLRPYLSLLALAPCLAFGAQLDRSTIVEAVNDVKIIAPGTRAESPARVQTVFRTPDLLRTGAQSRAEMVSEDQTVTRVGANSLFSFEPERRQLNLKKGSLLFYSPTGKGGGTIKTAAASAAVLGTTLIVSATANGGFKVLLLEGHGKVVTARGDSRDLRAGEMTYMLPGSKLGPVLTFQLKEQAGASNLVRGFRAPLASAERISAAIVQQEAKIGKGALIKTGLLAGDAPGEAFQISIREILVAKGRKALQKNGAAIARGVDRFQGAVRSDSIIQSGQLDPSHLFEIGNADRPSLLQLAGFPEFAQRYDSLGFFVGRNVALNAPQLDLNGVGGSGPFALIAADTFGFAQSTDILRQSSGVAFLAGAFKNAPGIVLRVSAPFVDFIAPGGVLDFKSPPQIGIGQGGGRSIANFGIANRAGHVGFVAAEIALDHVGVGASGDVGINSAGSVRITDAITANPRFQAPASVALASSTPNGRGIEAGGGVQVTARREIVVERVDFSADKIRLSAGTNLQIKGARFSNANFDSSKGGALLTAGGVLDVANARFQLRGIAMQAQTINLRAVSFPLGSRVILDSARGQLAPNPNSNQPSRPGFVNFINNVTYAGQPAQQAVGSAITIK